MNRLFFFAGLYAGTAALMKLAGFLLSLWLARTLTVDDYARWGLLYALQTGLTTFGIVGIVEAIVGLLRQHQSAKEQERLFASANGVFSITLVVSLAVLALLIFLFFDSKGFDLPTLVSVFLSGALLAWASLQAQIVRLEEKHFFSLSFNFLIPVSGLTGSLAGFMIAHTLQSFYWGSAVGLLLSLAVFAIGKIGFYRTAYRTIETRLILLRVAPYIAVTFLGWLSGYGNNFIVNSLFDASEVARFTFALAIGSIMQIVASALNQVWGPRFFRITREMPIEEVERQNRRFFGLQGVVLGLLSALILMAFSPVMRALGGNLAHYQSMNVELFFIFVAYVFLGPWSHCQNYFLAYDQGRRVMNIVLTTSCVGIVAWVLLMWSLGALGIYLGFFTQMVLRSVGILYFAKKSWPVKISWEGVAGGTLLVLGGLIVSRI